MHRLTLSLSLSLFLANLYILPTSATPYPTPSLPTISIDSGLLTGTTTTLPPSPSASSPTTTTVHKYLGIPFAAPPTRFRAPQPPPSWEPETIYDASEYKPGCIEQFNYPLEAREATMKLFGTPGAPAGVSEDCLNLNVFVPGSGAGVVGGRNDGGDEDSSSSSSGGGGKPVLFWIHGGNYMFGSGSRALYDGSSFAANQDVIVVTSNYRTNVFGFPGALELGAEERNLGLLDQRLALSWVQRNIASFGGDPAKVTIFGESAGAGSVDALITTPPPDDLFRAAILQSGQATINLTPANSTKSWIELTKAFNCPSSGSGEGGGLECMRAIPAEDIKEVIERAGLIFGPAPDGGRTWPDTPRRDRLESTDKDPRIARVPVMVGITAEEGRTFAAGQNDTEKFLREKLPQVPEEVIQAVLEEYPLGSPGIGNEVERLSAIMTELVMLCPLKIVAEESRGVGIEAWRYYYNASFANMQPIEGSGVYHSSEIELVFGTFPEEGRTEFQVELGREMQRAWADFAKEPDRGPGWEGVPQVAVLGGGVRAGEGDGDGDGDGGREVVRVVGSEVLDSRCRLFQGLYDGVS
ncbi:hypothetical protein FQN50_010003 [Emmonsiellopsis sp. PD_5]|nr:hypothetical protein FQN50_010003 [Emmonsiellopsis sp. PD_5]